MVSYNCALDIDTALHKRGKRWMAGDYLASGQGSARCAGVGECHLRRLRFNGESDGSTGVQPATCSQRSSLFAFA
jgi:hypothetical protein